MTNAAFANVTMTQLFYTEGGNKRKEILSAHYIYYHFSSVLECQSKYK